MSPLYNRYWRLPIINMIFEGPLWKFRKFPGTIATEFSPKEVRKIKKKINKNLIERTIKNSNLFRK